MAMMGAVFGLLGTVVSAMGTIAQGKAAEAAAEFEAKQLEMRGKEERAASQREALEKKREGDLVQSRFQASAAASGAGAGSMDPTIAQLSSDIAGQSKYGQLMERYVGEERKRGLDTQAKAREMEGEAARKGSMFSAFGTIVGGLSNFATKYGAGGPPAAMAPAASLDERNSFGYSYG
jgi:hypothetical protein